MPGTAVRASSDATRVSVAFPRYMYGAESFPVPGVFPRLIELPAEGTHFGSKALRRQTEDRVAPSRQRTGRWGRLGSGFQLHIEHTQQISTTKGDRNTTCIREWCE